MPKTCQPLFIVRPGNTPSEGLGFILLIFRNPLYLYNINSMRKFLGCSLAAVIGLTLAVLLVPGAQIPGDIYQVIKIILLAGIILGLLNFFIAPLLRLISFPVRWLFLGFFGLIIEIIFLELIDIIFTPEITFQGFWPIFWTGLLIWSATSILTKIWSKND